MMRNVASRTVRAVAARTAATPAAARSAALPVAARAAAAPRVSAMVMRYLSTHDGREVGSCKWFSAEKGYGFLTRPDGSDVFCHFSSIVGDGYRSLEEGQAVEFSVAAGPKGPVAQDVEVVSDGVDDNNML